MNYRPDIDGLRAIAVALVLLFHAKVPGFEAGYVGVDVFFVISGFLITSIVLNDIARDEFCFGSFYRRRAARLLPVLFVVLGITSAVGAYVLFPSAVSELGKGQIATLLYFSNIYFARTLDYFSSSADANPLVHTWSLSVEEQYYLIFPLLLLCIWRFAWRLRYAAIALLWMASLALAEYASRGAAGLTSEQAFFLLPTRSFELLTGVICAFARRDLGGGDRPARPWFADMWAGLGLVSILFYVARYRSAALGPGLAALVPVVGAGLLLLCADRGCVVRRLLGFKPLVGMGLVSYSLYLWHQPVLAFAREYSPLPLTAWQVAACLAATLALSYMSWRFVEHPLRRYGHKGGSLFVWVLVGVAVVLLVVGACFYKKVGYPALLRARLDAVEERVAFNYGLGKACSKVFNPAACGGSNAKVAIWGDSYGMHLYQALQVALPNVEIAQMTKGGCAPLTGHAFLADPASGGASFSRDCMAFHAAALNWLLEASSVRTVFVASPWAPFAAREAAWLVDTQGRQSQNAEVAMQDLLAAAQQLQRRGKQVIVVGTPPGSGRDNGHCLKAVIRADGPLETCNFSRSDSDGHLRRSANDVVQTLGSNLSVLDIRDLICAGDYCLASRSPSVFIFGSGGHLSREGSVYLGRQPKFQERLQQLGLQSSATSSPR